VEGTENLVRCGIFLLVLVVGSTPCDWEPWGFSSCDGDKGREWQFGACPAHN
jgi:hypothetical protein